MLGPLYGPVLTEAATFYPLFGLSVLTAASLCSSGIPIADAFTGVMALAVASYNLDSVIPSLLGPLVGKSWILTRCGLWHVIAGLYALANINISPFRPRYAPLVTSGHLLLLGTLLPALWWNFTQNTMCVVHPSLNQTLAQYNHSLIARHESLTGYISVLDNTDMRYRVLRCDHSLLGGEWQMVPKGYQWDQDREFKEPVYAIFVIMEAVRLVDPPPKARDGKQRALAM